MKNIYYDEDFYAEPYEFEEQIESLKSAISLSIQKRYLDEMDALRKENACLRDFRDKKDEYERELARTKQQCEAKMRDAERMADRKRLKDLLPELSVIGYRVHSNYTQGQKCDKCDEDRKIHFISPCGREMKEDCLCAKYIVTYSPKEVSLISFCVGKNISSVYYERTDEDRDYDRYDLCGEMYDGDGAVTFDKINQYRVVFRNKEDCQKYCDWLNNK